MKITLRIQFLGSADPVMVLEEQNERGRFVYPSNLEIIGPILKSNACQDIKLLEVRTRFANESLSSDHGKLDLIVC